MIQKLTNNKKIKFSFGKNTEFFGSFCDSIGAYYWRTPNYGLGIPDYLSLDNKLWAVI